MSTDIDGEPILILSLRDARKLVDLINYYPVNDDNPTIKKIRKFVLIAGGQVPKAVS